jgi:hypothetical protein
MGTDDQAQPSLKEYGPETQWSLWVLAELEGNQMFGKVQRHGKVGRGIEQQLIAGFVWPTPHAPLLLCA